MILRKHKNTQKNITVIILFAAKQCDNTFN